MKLLFYYRIREFLWQPRPHALVGVAYLAPPGNMLARVAGSSFMGNPQASLVLLMQNTRDPRHFESLIKRRYYKATAHHIYYNDIAVLPNELRTQNIYNCQRLSEN